MFVVRARNGRLAVGDLEQPIAVAREDMTGPADKLEWYQNIRIRCWAMRSSHAVVADWCGVARRVTKVGACGEFLSHCCGQLIVEHGSSVND